METTTCLKCGKNSTLQHGHLILPQAEPIDNKFVSDHKTAFIFKVFICDECNHVDLESIK